MAALCLLVQALIYRVVPTKERVLFSESSVIGGGGRWGDLAASQTHSVSARWEVNV